MMMNFTLLHCTAANGRAHSVCMSALFQQSESKRLNAGFTLNVNGQDDHEKTLLHYAAANGHLDCVRILIEEFKLDVNAQDDHEKTPLHHAAANGHADCARILIEEPKLDVNAQDDHEKTPLHHAIDNSHAECVRILIEEPKLEVNAQDDKLKTPLHYAAANGHLECIRILMQQPNIKLNVKDKDGRTPLHYVIGKEHLECPCVRSLVTSYLTKAHLMRNEFGETPLHYAVANYGRLDPASMVMQEFKRDVNEQDEQGRTQLHHAAANGHLECILILIQEFNLDVNAQDDHEKTPLHYAIDKGHLDCVRVLVKWYLTNEHSMRNKFGETPLHYTAANGHLECIHVLIQEFNLDVNAQDVCRRTPLHHAAANGHLHCVRILIEESKLDVNAQDDKLKTPLHYAIDKGHLECVRVLVKWYLTNEHSMRNEFGETPLHYAAANGQLECIRILTQEFKLDVNEQDEYGRAPLHYAVANGHLKCILILIQEPKLDVNAQNRRGKTPLHYAAANDHLECVRILIQKFKLDVNANDRHGKTALHYAAANGQLECIRILTQEFKLDVNAKDMHGRALLHHAAANGHLECIRILIQEFKLDVNAQDRHGKTPLHHAAANSHVDCVDILIEEFKLEVNTQDKRGRTPLHHAIANGRLDCARILIEEFNLDVNAQDKRGKTPLHYAAANGHMECACVLVERYTAKFHVQSKYGNTPLHYAASNGQVECVRLLVKCYHTTLIGQEMRNEYGRTPLHYAAANGHLECIRILIQEPNIKLNVKDKDDRTPLGYAVDKAHQHCVPVLKSAADTTMAADVTGTPDPTALISPGRQCHNMSDATSLSSATVSTEVAASTASPTGEGCDSVSLQQSGSTNASHRKGAGLSHSFFIPFSWTEEDSNRSVGQSTLDTECELHPIAILHDLFRTSAKLKQSKPLTRKQQKTLYHSLCAEAHLTPTLDTKSLKSLSLSQQRDCVDALSSCTLKRLCYTLAQDLSATISSHNKYFCQIYKDSATPEQSQPVAADGKHHNSAIVIEDLDEEPSAATVTTTPARIQLVEDLKQASPGMIALLKRGNDSESLVPTDSFIRYLDHSAERCKLSNAVRFGSDAKSDAATSATKDAAVSSIIAEYQCKLTFASMTIASPDPDTKTQFNICCLDPAKQKWISSDGVDHIQSASAASASSSIVNSDCPSMTTSANPSSSRRFWVFHPSYGRAKRLINALLAQYYAKSEYFGSTLHIIVVDPAQLPHYVDALAGLNPERRQIRDLMTQNCVFLCLPYNKHGIAFSRQHILDFCACMYKLKEQGAESNSSPSPSSSGMHTHFPERWIYMVDDSSDKFHRLERTRHSNGHFWREQQTTAAADPYVALQSILDIAETVPNYRTKVAQVCIPKSVWPQHTPTLSTIAPTPYASSVVAFNIPLLTSQQYCSVLKFDPRISIAEDIVFSTKCRDKNLAVLKVGAYYCRKLNNLVGGCSDATSKLSGSAGSGPALKIPIGAEEELGDEKEDDDTKQPEEIPISPHMQEIAADRSDATSKRNGSAGLGPAHKIPHPLGADSEQELGDEKQEDDTKQPEEIPISPHILTFATDRSPAVQLSALILSYPPLVVQHLSNDEKADSSSEAKNEDDSTSTLSVSNLLANIPQMTFQSIVGTASAQVKQPLCATHTKKLTDELMELQYGFATESDALPSVEDRLSRCTAVVRTFMDKHVSQKCGDCKKVDNHYARLQKGIALMARSFCSSTWRTLFDRMSPRHGEATVKEANCRVQNMIGIVAEMREECVAQAQSAQAQSPHGKFQQFLMREFITEFNDVCEVYGKLIDGCNSDANSVWNQSGKRPHWMQALTAYRMDKYAAVANWSSPGSGKSAAALLSAWHVKARRILLVAPPSVANDPNGFPLKIMQMALPDPTDSSREWIEFQIDSKAEDPVSSQIVFLRDLLQDYKLLQDSLTCPRQCSDACSLSSVRAKSAAVTVFVMCSYDTLSGLWKNNPDATSKLLGELKIDMMIMDESQNIQYKSKQSCATAGRTIDAIQHSVKKLILLSATPFTAKIKSANVAIDLLHCFSACFGASATSKPKWLQHHASSVLQCCQRCITSVEKECSQCACGSLPLGNARSELDVYCEFLHLHAVRWNRDINSFMTLIKYAPKPVSELKDIEELSKLYTSLQQAYAKTDDATRFSADNRGLLRRMTKLRLEYVIIPAVRAAVSNNEQVIVYTHEVLAKKGKKHKSEIVELITGTLEKELADATIKSESAGKRSVAIRRYIGGTPKKLRTNILNAFSAAKIDVLVTSRVIAVGVDGLQHASTLVFNFVPWTYADYLQVVGRVVRLPSCNDRTTRKKLVTVYQGRLEFLYTVTGKYECMDEKRWKAVDSREHDLSATLDGVKVKERQLLPRDSESAAAAAGPGPGLRLVSSDSVTTVTDTTDTVTVTESQSGPGQDSLTAAATTTAAAAGPSTLSDRLSGSRTPKRKSSELTSRLSTRRGGMPLGPLSESGANANARKKPRVETGKTNSGTHDIVTECSAITMLQ
jgi:ankyrin repeat protein